MLDAWKTIKKMWRKMNEKKKNNAEKVWWIECITIWPQPIAATIAVAWDAHTFRWHTEISPDLSCHNFSLSPFLHVLSFAIFYFMTFIRYAVAWAKFVRIERCENKRDKVTKYTHRDSLLVLSLLRSLFNSDIVKSHTDNAKSVHCCSAIATVAVAGAQHFVRPEKNWEQKIQRKRWIEWGNRNDVDFFCFSIDLILAMRRQWKRQMNFEHSPRSRSFTSDAARSPSARNARSIFFDRSIASLSLDALTAQPIFYWIYFFFR